MGHPAPSPPGRAEKLSLRTRTPICTQGKPTQRARALSCGLSSGVGPIRGERSERAKREERDGSAAG